MEDEQPIFQWPFRSVRCAQHAGAAAQEERWHRRVTYHSRSCVCKGSGGVQLNGNVSCTACFGSVSHARCAAANRIAPDVVHILCPSFSVQIQQSPSDSYRPKAQEIPRVATSQPTKLV